MGRQLFRPSVGTSYVEAAKTASINSLWTTFGVLFGIVILVFMYRYYRDKQTSEKFYVGNVGSQGTYTDVQSQPINKQLQCYQDNDCPDETRCNEKGICTPIIHPLPIDFHQLKLGRGRQSEKPSAN